MEKKKKLEDLLVSVSENDDYAFRVFYDLYYRSVFRFTYYFLRNKEACGEVVSNVFVAVWKSRVSLRRISNIVARNESNRYLRECQAQRRCLSLEDIPISVLDLNSPPHDGEAPDSRLLESEVEELVRRLINDLPERCRTVFLLNRQEGLSSGAVALRKYGARPDQDRRRPDRDGHSQTLSRPETDLPAHVPVLIAFLTPSGRKNRKNTKKAAVPLNGTAAFVLYNCIHD